MSHVSLASITTSLNPQKHIVVAFTISPGESSHDPGNLPKNSNITIIDEDPLEVLKNSSDPPDWRKINMEMSEDNSDNSVSGR